MLHSEFPRALLLSPLAALLLALAPNGAVADEMAMIRNSVTVQVSDLNLKRPADAARLYQRIRRAAERACGDGLVSSSPLAQPADRDCVRNAIAAAMSNLSEPLVTAVHLRGGSWATGRAGA